MSTRAIVGLASLALLVAVSPARAQQEPEDLFQSGRYAEEVEGDLRGALRIFQNIVANFPSHRTVVAAALVRIGRAYETLGEIGARQAYRRVLSDYPDQAEAAAEARSRLTSLQLAAPTESNVAALEAAARADGNLKTSDLTLRRVWRANDLDIEGQVSHDGRYIPFRDDKTGDLSVRDLTTGQNRRVTRNRDPSQSLQDAQLSDDNRRIAYGWSVGDNVSELRVIGLDGSGERTVYGSGGVRHIDVDGWSTDGDHILAGISREDGTFQIAWISMEDGSVQVLKTLNWTQYGGPHMHLSPDGRWIAYDFLQRERFEQEENIALLAADGSREITVVSHPEDDDLVAWLPDGSGLLFRSDRLGVNDLWLLELEPGGTPRGEPRLVKKNIGGIDGRGFTESGMLYYDTQAVKLEDVYLARLDPVTGRAVETPSRANADFENATRLPAWSLDGTRLAYFVEGDGPRQPTIVIRDLASGDERLLPIDVLHRGPGPSALRWAPDGGSLAFRGVSTDQGFGIFRIDAETGRTTPIVTVPEGVWVGGSPEGVWVGGSAWAPDGQAIFYVTLDFAAVELRIVRLDLATGEEKQLHSFVGQPTIAGGMAISPDGGYLAVMNPFWPQGHWRPTQLLVLSTAGGELREVYRVPDGEHLINGLLDWTPQGDLIFATHQHEDAVGDPMTELWRMGLDGEERESLGLALVDTKKLSVHPDGTWIALHLDYELDELWAMENLLSELRVSGRR